MFDSTGITRSSFIEVNLMLMFVIVKLLLIYVIGSLIFKIRGLNFDGIFVLCAYF